MTIKAKTVNIYPIAMIQIIFAFQVIALPPHRIISEYYCSECCPDEYGEEVEE